MVSVNPTQPNLGLEPEDWMLILGDDIAGEICDCNPSIADTLDALVELVCPSADQIKLLPGDNIEPRSFFQRLLGNGFRTCLISHEEFDLIRELIEPRVGLISVTNA